MGKWPLVRLGDVCEIGAGQGAPQGVDKYCRQGTPFIKAGNLADLVNGCSENEIQQVNDEVAKEYALRIYPKGTIVFAKSGMSCMKGYVYKLKRDCYVVNHLACVIPRKVYGSYLKYCLEKYPPNRLIKDASYPSISLSDIANLKIPLPPLNVQKHIANVLDKTQEIIDGHKKQLAELDNLIIAVFYEMFGDPLANDKGWTTVLLKEVLANIRYGTSTPPNFSETGYKFIRATNIKKGRIVEEDMKFISKEESLKLKKCKIYENEMIIVRSGVNSGDTCVISNEYSGHYAGYDLILTFDQNKVDPVFVNELFNTNYMEIVIKPLTRRAAQPHLNSEQVQSLRIILPPLDLQTKFANIVTKIEEQKALVKQAIAESEHLFNSLMSEYFD